MNLEANLFDPRQFSYEGDFYEQMDTIFNVIRLKREEVTRLKILYADLADVMGLKWPGSTVEPFGSIVTGLGITTSDADCYINIPQVYRTPEEIFVVKAKALLNLYPHIFQKVLFIAQAKVPIVKFYHVPTSRNCDVSFKSPSGVCNSALISFMFSLDKRILPMAILIKYWSKVHGLTGTNLFSNYALLMLIIFYLQQIKMLPSVEWLQSFCSPYFVDNWNTSYLDDAAYIHPSENQTPLHMMLGGFFTFYKEFDFKLNIISPFIGRSINREDFTNVDTLPNGFNLYKENCHLKNCRPLQINTKYCVQDVFDHSRNCTAVMSARVANMFIEFINLASNIYEQSATNNYTLFLKDILTRVPYATPIKTKFNAKPLMFKTKAARHRKLQEKAKDVKLRQNFKKPFNRKREMQHGSKKWR